MALAHLVQPQGSVPLADRMRVGAAPNNSLQAPTGFVEATYK